MKKFTRILIGFLSSALLAVGFARAASAIDPISLSLGQRNIPVDRAGPGSTLDCWGEPEGK